MKNYSKSGQSSKTARCLAIPSIQAISEKLRHSQENKKLPTGKLSTSKIELNSPSLLSNQPESHSRKSPSTNSLVCRQPRQRDMKKLFYGRKHRIQSEDQNLNNLQKDLEIAQKQAKQFSIRFEMLQNMFTDLHQSLLNHKKQVAKSQIEQLKSSMNIGESTGHRKNQIRFLAKSPYKSSVGRIKLPNKSSQRFNPCTSQSKRHLDLQEKLNLIKNRVTFTLDNLRKF